MWRTAHVPLVYVCECACVCQCANGICKIANCRSRCGPLYAFLPSSLPYQFTINASVNMFKKVATWCCMRLTQMIVIRIESVVQCSCEFHVTRSHSLSLACSEHHRHHHHHHYHWWMWSPLSTLYKWNFAS